MPSRRAPAAATIRMQPYKREFIEFMLRSEVLTFGDFVTKSGRPTPYFINTGRYRRGAQVHALGRYYARALVERLGDDFDVLFGPAYKGIPIVVATALVLSAEFGRDVRFCFDRKEAKDHGEGGTLVGHVPQPGERVVILEDVTTAGTSVRHTVPLLRAAADVELAGLLVSVDRMERGQGETSALAELAHEFAMPCFAIVTIDEIVDLLASGETPSTPGPEALDRVRHYRAEFGARP